MRPLWNARRKRRARRAAYLSAGLALVGVGVVGAFLPLMPSTIFFIAATGCFARSSPRLERWLLDHPSFGPAIRAWRDHGAIPVRGKIAACIGMAVGYLLFLWSAAPNAPLAALVAALLAANAAYVVSRPSGQ